MYESRDGESDYPLSKIDNKNKCFVDNNDPLLKTIILD
jgi:hypothetical protein